jgi:hypothetical protein
MNVVRAVYSAETRWRCDSIKRRAIGSSPRIHPNVCIRAMPPQGLLRRYLHACCDERTIGRHRTAAGCGPLAGDDGGVASRSAIGGQEQLILSALHAAVRGVAIRSNDANAESGAGRTGIAFRARGARRSRIALGSRLALTATHQSARQRDRNEDSQHAHGHPSEEAATACPISPSSKRPTEPFAGKHRRRPQRAIV